MDGQLKYSKLMNDLKQQILSGAIKPGEKIPSENQLSTEYGISRQTVRKAIGNLSVEGYVYAEHGRGTFVSDVIKQSGESKNVAVLMTYLSDYIFPYVIKGIDEILEASNYSILLKSTHNSRKAEGKCLEDLLQKNIDGLIIEPSKSHIACKNRDTFAMLERYHIPYVFIQGIYHGMEDKPYVLLDDCKGTYLVTKYMIEQGHKSIAGIFKADDRQGQERHKGYVKALQEAGMMYDATKVIWYHTEDWQNLPSEMLLELVKEMSIDGVVAYNDKIAIEVIQNLQKSGYHVPDDISVAGFDDSLLGKNFQVPLTTVRHPQDKLGEAAADLLLQLMKGTVLSDEQMHILMEPELVVRDSVRSRIVRC